MIYSDTADSSDDTSVRWIKNERALSIEELAPQRSWFQVAHSASREKRDRLTCEAYFL